MQLEAGFFLRDYEIEKLLGKGGMGTVYLAKDSFLDRYVAIKELSPLLTADAGLVERFRNEARMQAKLNHAGIVSLHSFFEQNGRYYMVMEYASGRTLKDIIRQTGPIPEARALKILKQAVSALEYAHEMGIVHRDIKPSNIILDDNDRVKILDFGIARIMGERGLTQTGQQLGTVAYMSPEQVQAEKDIDGKTDIYSLGVTFFEMLSGRMPYDMNTESDFVVMNKIVHDTLPDPRDYYPQVSDATIRLLARMTQKDRYQRADIAELESYLSGNYDVGVFEKRKEEKDTVWLGVGQDGVVLGDIAKDLPPAKKEKSKYNKLLWLSVLIPILVVVLILLNNTKTTKTTKTEQTVETIEEYDEFERPATDQKLVILDDIEENHEESVSSNPGSVSEAPAPSSGYRQENVKNESTNDYSRQYIEEMNRVLSSFQSYASGLTAGYYTPFIENPVLLSEISPVYPAYAIRNKIQGTVVLDAEVLKDGSIRGISVKQSVDDGVDQAVINAFKKAKYKPGTSNGIPTDMQVTISYEVQID